MHRELQPPRESIVDLALLMEEQLTKEGVEWSSGDGVMDLFHLKRILKEQEERLDQVLRKIQLQGLDVSMTTPQRRALRREAVALASVCMQILDVCGILDSSKEL